MTEAFKNINPFIFGLLIILGIGLILELEREYDKLKEGQGFSGILTLSKVLTTGYQAFLIETALTNIAETTIYNLDCFEKQILSGNEVTID